MLINLIRWLKGYVKFEVKGKFPERFMNLCLRQGIFLFDTGPQNGRFMGTMHLSDYKKIRFYARKAGVRLKITKRVGLPFLLREYRGRKGIAVGIILYILVSFLMQNFIWTIEINGLEALSRAQVRNCLRENGLYIGAYKGNLNYHAIERKVMQEIEEIGWMSINVTGTKIETEIEEKTPIPFINPDNKPCNLKSEADGVILSMDIKKGSSKLTVGSGVIKGQLLVSGVTQNSLGENSFVHASADIVAATEHYYSQTILKKGVYNKFTEDAKRKSLNFLWLHIPFGFASVKEPYTSIVVKENLCLNNTSVPLGVSTQFCMMYEEEEFELTETEINEIVNIKDYMYRLYTLKDCREITASLSLSLNEDEATAYIKYNCIENIGVEEMIIVN